MLKNENYEQYFLYDQKQPKQIDFLEKVLKLGIKFVSGEVRDGKVLNYLNLDELKNLFDESLPIDGLNFDELIDTLENKVAKYSIAQSDQKFLAFPDTGNSVATLAADILSAFLNQNLIAVDRSAPSATFVEMQVLMWLRQLVNYPTYSLKTLPDLAHVGGMWTSGGNMSNYTAVLVALNNKFPQIKKEGLTSLSFKPGIVLAKGIEHFSFSGAAASLGLGEEGLIWSKADKNYNTDIEALENTIKNCPNTKKPFMLVCVAGNCRTTSIDNIKACAILAKKYNLWFHVDACHGGNLLFSRSRRHYLEGIELADSISLDPHKGLFLTYPSSYVLFKDPATLAKFCRYPTKASDPTVLDLGLIMPFFGSRGFHSLKLWLLIKHLGFNGIADAIDQRHEINIHLSQQLKETNLFILLNDNNFYRQAFVFLPKECHKLMASAHTKHTAFFQELVSKYTELFCETLYKDGQVVFDLFSLTDNDNRIKLGVDYKYVTMAMAIGHPLMSQTNIQSIMEQITKLGNKLKLSMLNDIHNFDSRINNETFTCSVNTSPASW